MKKHIISTLAIIAMLALLLCSCGGSSLTGRWVDDKTVSRPEFCSQLEIFSDGTYSSEKSNYSGKYSVDNNRIKFEGILVSAETFTFKVSGKTLTLYDNDGKVVGQYQKTSD